MGLVTLRNLARARLLLFLVALWQILWLEHRLRRAGDAFRIAHKRVDLVNSEGELDGIAILF